MTGQALPKIEKLRTLARDGKTLREASAAVGIGYAYASVLAKQNGITFAKVANLRLTKLRECASQGLSRRETADRLGLSLQTIYKYSQQHGIEFAKKYQVSADVRFEQLSRAVEFAKLYREGKTLEEIGQLHGVTRERVRQIMTKHIGIRANDGGKHKIAQKKERERNAKRDAKSFKKWGCKWADYVRLRALHGPTLRFASQRQNAIRRGIAWELTLWQWWQIWEKSGRWHERGRGRGYCMCRLNHTGPYAVDNVYIATGVENMQDHWVLRRAAQNVGVAA